LTSTSASADARNRQERGRLRRRQILDAAVELFAAKGYRGTGVAALADRVGMTATGLLYYFGTKERLLQEVVGERDRVDTADPVASLTLSGLRDLGRHNAETATLTRLYVVLGAESLDPGHPLHDFFVRRYETGRHLVRSIVEAERERGRLRPDVDVEQIAREVLAVLMGLEIQWLADPDRIDLPATIEAYIDRLVDQLGLRRRATTSTTATAEGGRQGPFVPPAPPRTAKAAATRQRLLDAAGDLFIEHGYHGVSMQDIAAAAGLTKGALYGHFRSKGQLLVEVIRWKLAEREHSAYFADALRDPDTAIDLLHDVRAQDIRVLQVDAAAAARHDPDVAAGMADLYAERDAAIRAALSDHPDPETTAWFLATISAGVGMKEAMGLPPPDPERFRAAVRAMGLV
jgi:AcrR family transcriptional regulator